MKLVTNTEDEDEHWLNLLRIYKTVIQKRNIQID